MSRAEILERLEGVIAARASERPEGSYVVSLLEGGPERIAAKLREEAEELIEAAAEGSAGAVAHEAADVLFHALVMLRARGVALAEGWVELEGRFGIGGLAEKAARAKADPC